jgi:hypothetical protein
MGCAKTIGFNIMADVLMRLRIMTNKYNKTLPRFTKKLIMLHLIFRSFT